MKQVEAAKPKVRHAGNDNVDYWGAQSDVASALGNLNGLLEALVILAEQETPIPSQLQVAVKKAETRLTFAEQSVKSEREKMEGI